MYKRSVILLFFMLSVSLSVLGGSAGSNPFFREVPQPIPIGDELKRSFFEINHGHPAVSYQESAGVVFTSDPFTPGDQFGMALQHSGFLKQFRLELVLVSEPADSIELLVRSSPIITNWEWITWNPPKGWENQPCVVQISMRRPAHPLTVFGFSTPGSSLPPKAVLNPLKVAQTAGLTVFLAILMILPGVWIQTEFINSKAMHARFLFPSWILLSTAWVYGMFWIYLLHAWAGIVLSVLTVTVACLRLARYSSRFLQLIRIHRDLRYPLMLWIGASLLALMAGFLYGGWDDPVLTAQNRYLEAPLPYDNLIPLAFAERLYHGHPLQPFLSGWLTSDRPPLQTAWTLAVMPWFGESAVGYQVLSTLLQSLAIPGLFLLGRVVLNPQQSWGLALLGMFSSTFLLNSFYVWPKLLPVFYCALTYLLLFHPEQTLSGTAYRIRSLLIGGTAALAMLTHGSSLFSLIGIFGIAWILGKLKWSQWGWVLLAGVACMLPWILYQKLIDPPGNRLLFWHLAGFHGIPEHGFLETLMSQYRSLDLATWFHYKWVNIQTLLGSWSMAMRHLFPYQWSNHFHLLRSGMFLSLVIAIAPILPLLILAPLFFISQSLRSASRAIGWQGATLVLTVIVWVLLIFSPGRTILHHGSYLMVFQLVFVLGIPLFRLSTILGSGFVLLNAAWIFVVWVMPGQAHLEPGQWVINSNQPDLACLSAWLLFAVLLFIPAVQIRTSKRELSLAETGHDGS